MPSREDITYFGAGPALLPTDVLEKAAAALVNYENTGLGIAEHSHRSQIANDIINNAKADLCTYLDIPSDEYEVLFMQGGGSGQFSSTVYHMVASWLTHKKERLLDGLDEDTTDPRLVDNRVADSIEKKHKLKIDYVVTGSWSLKAYQEAVRLLGEEYINLVCDARKYNDGKFGKIPPQEDWKLSEDAAMVYYCDNETVDGVEFPEFPAILAPKADGSGPIVVADMSSNILSRRVPVKNYTLFFFGAQKNLGSTGITVAVMKKSFLPPQTTQPRASLMRRLRLPVAPVILDYGTIAKNNSLYNTLSIFDVYIAGQVLKKLLATFPDKVDGQQALADEKASLIYAMLEAYPDIYRIVPDKSVRSRMNICFRVLKGQGEGDVEKSFLDAATQNGLTGLKGHRSVGGIRASNYNSIPLEGAEKLALYLKTYALLQ